MKKYISILAVAAGIAASLIIAMPAFAQGNPGGGWGMGRGGGQMQKPGVFGTVSAISGNTITITARQGFNNTTAATTYTVNATNATVTKNNVASTVASIAVGDTVAVQGTVNGTNVTATIIRDGVMMGNRGGMGVAGNVSAINGTTLTVVSKARPNGGTSTTYTVDASSATVTKNGTASSVSNIAVGDTVMVQGTTSGTSVAAKTIRDGVPQAQPDIQGNGQPVVAGSVTAINGNTITITNKSNITYTIDVENAKFSVAGISSPTISNVATGDNVVVQGAVNGANVTASSVIDQKAKPDNNANNPGNKKPDSGFMGGMMGGVVDFFKHLFGF
jgi:hypothetical protein